MLAVMSRATKNVGDDLIFQRGLSILKYVAPSENFVEGKAWLPLGDSFDPATRSALRGILVPGGPGARDNLPATYPFLQDAQDLGLPVFFLGVGTRFFPGTPALARHMLDAPSQRLLRELSARQPIGVRDYLSLELLRHNGVSAQMNGCPAWYALDMLDAPVQPISQIKRVAFTGPADARFASQSVALLRALRRLLPEASVLVGFHRGIDPGTGASAASGDLSLLEEARKLGCEHVDLSGSATNLSHYAECDLHVGYRVHAHIYFLSLHKASCLIAEDARGWAVLHALGGVGRPGWSAFAENAWLRRITSISQSRLLIASEDEIALWFELTLERERDMGFPHVAAAAGVIGRTFQRRMRPFVERLLASVNAVR